MRAEGVLRLASGPVEVVLEDETDALDGVGCAEGVLVHSVRICLGTELAIASEHIFVAIAEIAVDEESAQGLNLELRLVLLRSGCPLAVGSDIESEGERIGNLAKPVVDLPRHSGREDRERLVDAHAPAVLQVLGRIEAVEDKEIEHLSRDHIFCVDDRPMIDLTCEATDSSEEGRLMPKRITGLVRTPDRLSTQLTGTDERLVEICEASEPKRSRREAVTW